MTDSWDEDQYEPEIDIEVDAISSPPPTPSVGDMDTIPTPGPDPRVGTLLDGRYLLLGLIGEGGMGHVYRANHVLMDKPVAIKLIHDELAHIEDVAKRFEREARSSSRLTDPHCITVTDFGRADDGTLFLVMELLEGEELDYRIERTGAINVADALKIASQILKGLSHAHGQGVVHRDLKPENVFLTEQGGQKDFVKILDFGIAKLATGGGSNEKLTKSGIVFGTPKYLSPEQALGDQVDHRADLYAVGVILYEMLTGHPPFIADTAMDTLSMHLTADPPSLSEQGLFPRGLQDVLDKALAKKPDHRYQSANEFLAAIEAVDPNADPPSGVYEVFSKLSGRRTTITKTIKKGPHPSVVVLIILVLAGLVAAGYWYFNPFSRRGDISTAPPVVSVSEKVGDLGDNTEKIKGLLERADSQIREGRAAEAVITVKEALDSSPGLAPAILLLGHAQFLSGDREGAMLSYEDALQKDQRLASDVRLTEHLRAAFEWKGLRQKAAGLLAQFGGESGLALLEEMCNSALTEGDVRRDAREALVKAGQTKRVDWLTSLTADFHELKKCKQRVETINLMKDSGDPRFLPLLESFKPVIVKNKWGRKKKTTNACIGAAVLEAIEVLKNSKQKAGDSN